MKANIAYVLQAKETKKAAALRKREGHPGPDHQMIMYVNHWAYDKEDSSFCDVTLNDDLEVAAPIRYKEVAKDVANLLSNSQHGVGKGPLVDSWEDVRILEVKLYADT